MSSLEPYKPLILYSGPIVGYLTFIIGTVQTKNVYFRPDANNKQKFTFNGLLEFMKAPVQPNNPAFDTVWANYKIPLMDKLKLLQLNWVFTTASGLALSVILCKFI